jgi:hypothetical protein
MKLLRAILRLSILLLAYSTVITTILCPWVGVGMAFVAVAGLARRGVRYTAFGSSRWADTTDLPSHMLEGGDR